MVKIVTIYLPNEDEKRMDRFCSEFNLSPYRAVKLAIEVMLKDYEEKLQSKEAPTRKPEKPKEKTANDWLKELKL